MTLDRSNNGYLSKSDLAAARRRMIDEHLRGRGIHDPSVLSTMKNTPRERFVPPELVHRAYDDRALAVGFEQTISQPYIVAYMTEALRLSTSFRVLEIGTGTGYQTAILAQLSRHVYSVERVPELVERARRTLSVLGVVNATLILGDGSLGLTERAPFDRIMITAGAPEVPPSLLDQLAPGGILVAPIGGEADQQIVRVTMSDDGSNRTASFETLIGCRFVKLVGREGWSDGDS